MSGVACVLFLSFSVIDLTEDSQLAQEPSSQDWDLKAG